MRKALYPSLSVLWVYLSLHYWVTLRSYMNLGLINLPVYAKIETWFLYSLGFLTLTLIAWVRSTPK